MPIDLKIGDVIRARGSNAWLNEGQQYVIVDFQPPEALQPNMALVYIDTNAGFKWIGIDLELLENDYSTFEVVK